MNAVIIAIIVMVVLSLSRVSVVFSLIIAAIVGGLIGGLSINETIKVFTDGLGNGATIALSYAVLGAFAVALSRSGLAESMAQAAIRKLTGDPSLQNKPSEKNTKIVTYMLLSVLAIAAVSSQNLIPVHIAFIPILVPPLLSLMNTLKLDRRLAACVLTFGLVATYMFLPVGFGSIFLYDLLLKNLNSAGESVGLVIDHSIVVKSMAIPFLGMVFGLLVAFFYSYRKPREYDVSEKKHPITAGKENITLDSKSKSNSPETHSPKTFKKLQHWQIGMLIIALIGTVVLQLSYDSMILGGLFGFAVLSVTGVFRWQEQDSVFVEGIRMMALVGFIMISAAGFAAVMKATGHVDTLVQTSMSYIGDNKGLASFAMLAVGLFITMGIGSSFSTIPIITVIFVPIAFQLGFSPAAIVAIVGTSAALGDAGSPASDSTLGPTSGLNADGQHDHIWDSVVPTFIHYNLPLLVFGWVASMIL